MGRLADPPVFKRLEFHLTYTCPQACVFCSEEERMDAYKDHPVSLREAATVLAEKRREGFDHVTFTGGEPTIYPHFDKLLRFSKKIGYRTYATTNGNTLAFPSFVRKALPYLDELCLSVHGPDAQVHDGATGDRGSFRLLDRALANIDASDCEPYVLINFVVTPVNVASLPATLAYVSRFRKVRHFLVSNLASEGGGKAHYRELAVPLRRLAREVPELARLAEERGIELRLFGVPACALGRGYEKYANDFHWSPRATVERKRDAAGRVGLVEIRGWTPTRGRLQTPRCAPCIYRGVCPGVFERYIKEYGDSEIEPILQGSVHPAFGRGFPLVEDQETAFWPSAPTPAQRA
jgi:MoaA/NifB/PqqE/SkfB family radical SAM enzyme